jgi:hypothetical protein
MNLGKARAQGEEMRAIIHALVAASIVIAATCATARACPVNLDRYLSLRISSNIVARGAAELSAYGFSAEVETGRKLMAKK